MTANRPSEDQDRFHLAVIEDPNVKIKPGIRLKQFLQSKARDASKYLSLGEVKELYAAVKKEEGIYLNELLEGSEVVLPHLTIPPRNPVLEKRIRELRNSLDQREYNRMTKNVDLSKRFIPSDTVGHQMKQMNSGLIAVFQFVVTVGAAFMFGFMGVEVFFSVSFELAIRLLLGIIFGLVVAGAELFFLLRNLDLAEMSQEERISTPLHAATLNKPPIKVD